VSRAVYKMGIVASCGSGGSCFAWDGAHRGNWQAGVSCAVKRQEKGGVRRDRHQLRPQILEGTRELCSDHIDGYQAAMGIQSDGGHDVKRSEDRSAKTTQEPPVTSYNMVCARLVGRR
jgi:hypothetical protein